MYCIDSWAWIEYLNAGAAGTKAAKHIDSREPLACTPLTLFEVSLSALKNGSQEAAREGMRKMREEFGTIVQELDDELVFSAAKIKKEEGLAMADAFLLATARKRGVKIVTGDPDFKKFEETIFIGDQGVEGHEAERPRLGERVRPKSP